jgi:DNA-binding beta-propeller fold protein YncE
MASLQNVRPDRKFDSLAPMTARTNEVQVPSVTIGESSTGEVGTGQSDVVAVLQSYGPAQTVQEIANEKGTVWNGPWSETYVRGFDHPETLAQYNDNNAEGIFGIGPNQTDGLARESGGYVPDQQQFVIGALPGDLKDGEFFQLNGSAGTGTVQFGPSQDFIDGGISSSGAPTSPVLVEIGDNPMKEVDAVFDSGGLGGNVPESANGGETSIAPGTVIAVYNLDHQLLYEYSTGAPDGTPNVIPDNIGSDGYPEMNTGIAAFEYGGDLGGPDPLTDGVYVSNTGDGTLIFPRLDTTDPGGSTDPGGPPSATDLPVVATISGVGTGEDEIAVSPTGPEAGDIYITDPYPGTLSVIDPSTNTIVHTIDLGPLDTENGPLGVVVSPTGPEAGDIYITGHTGVSVIDPSTNTIVHTIEVADGNIENGSLGVAVSPTGPEAGDVYVVDGSDAVAVIDPSTNTVVQTIDLPGEQLLGVAVGPAGPEAGDIYVTSEGTGAAPSNVAVIDPSTNTVVQTIDLDEPREVAVSPTGPDAGDIYVGEGGQCATCVAVIDPSTNTVAAIYTVDSQVGEDTAVAVSPTGPEAGDFYITDSANGTVLVSKP